MNAGWPMDEMFVVETHQESLAYDQYSRAPITRSVQSSREILERVFDMITYGKAAAVLRMLRHIVTEQHFRSSVRKYLNDHRWVNRFVSLYKGAVPTGTVSGSFAHTAIVRGPCLNVANWKSRGRGCPNERGLRDFREEYSNIKPKINFLIIITRIFPVYYFWIFCPNKSTRKHN